MKEDLSRKEITRCIANGFEVYMKYRVGLGGKIWKNGRKIHILDIFKGHVPVHLGPVQVQFRFLSILANLYRYRSEL